MQTGLFALAIACAVSAGAFAAEGPLGGPRIEVCLNGDWLRHAGGDVAQVPEQGWETVRVPEYPGSAAKGSAWFRLDFAVPVDLTGEGRRVVLRLVRVRHYARVFVNGRQCGENYGARAPFEVDVTDAVRPGEVNRLEVWVHDCGGAYAMPGKVVEDLETLKRLSTLQGYREQATIAEDVFLISRPDLYVSDVLVMPSVRERSLSVRLTLTNLSARERTAALTNVVFLGDLRVLALPSQDVRLAAGESRAVTVSAAWADPHLWGYPPYGEPVLYHVDTQLLEGPGRATDRLVTRFGFREVWTEGDRIMLNGKELRVLGYWVPEGSGRSQWTLRMAAVQSAGCNAIHNHAEQREPAYYDVADEMGLFVWDADYCGGPLGTTSNMTNATFPDVLAELERQYPLWARSVANHPSVVILMMECLFNPEAASRLGTAYKKADPTRLIHSGGGMVRPMDLAAYASDFEMESDDPLSSIRSTYESWGRNLRDFEGRRVPLVNKEIWYKYEWSRRPTDEALAKATADALDYLRVQDLPGLILYSQQAFLIEPDATAVIKWPSRSGEGQLAETVVTGGLPWGQHDFVNLSDPAKPAFEPLPMAQAVRAASLRYLGHEVSVAAVRRPEVIVQVTRAGAPVPDAYVFAVPISGTVASPVGMRTDRDGTAWFQLRDPGRYAFTCRAAGGRAQAELDCLPQPLGLTRGGVGDTLRAELRLEGAVP